MFLTVILASVVQFVLGAFWYSPLMFGKWWMKFMDCDKISKVELQKMQKTMMPFYGLQFVLTIFTTYSLVTFISWLPSVSPYTIACQIFIGFLAPTQIASVIWGKTEKKYWPKQIFVMVSNSLVSILLATYIVAY